MACMSCRPHKPKKIEDMGQPAPALQDAIHEESSNIAPRRRLNSAPTKLPRASLACWPGLMPLDRGPAATVSHILISQAQGASRHCHDHADFEKPKGTQ